MKSLKLAEKHHVMASHLTPSQLFKPERQSLPIIREKGQRDGKKCYQYFDWQLSPKIFINSQQALVWIKKDIERKTRHDVMELLKRKVENQLTLEKAMQDSVAENRQRRSLNLHLIRKYTTTSRCNQQVSKEKPGDVSMLTLWQKKRMQKNFKPKKNQQNFLSIKIVETHQPVKAKKRFNTERISQVEDEKSGNFKKVVKKLGINKSESTFPIQNELSELSPW